MKIRLDKKKLFAGVVIIHEMADLYRDNLKVRIWYSGTDFYLKNYETTNVMIFESYRAFRKQLSLDVANW